MTQFCYFPDITLGAGISQTQSDIVASKLRALKGRDFIEAGVRNKQRAMRGELDDFFKVEGHMVDSSKKDEQIVSQVQRYVSYVIDINEFVSYIKEARHYDPRNRIFIRFGMDGGGK